jgi:hypothetical protein
MAVMVWKLDLHLTMETLSISTEVVSSIPVQGELYSIHVDVMTFASNLIFDTNKTDRH